jgi:hypothetical protein
LSGTVLAHRSQFFRHFPHSGVTSNLAFESSHQRSIMEAVMALQTRHWFRWGKLVLKGQ